MSLRKQAAENSPGREPGENIPMIKLAPEGRQKFSDLIQGICRLAGIHGKL